MLPVVLHAAARPLRTRATQHTSPLFDAISSPPSISINPDYSLPSNKKAADRV
jgi:hypothetical protein